MNGQHELLKTYRVQVGFWTVEVKAPSAETAIQEARRKIARELPRLYDVIRELASARFEVKAAA